ncbi:cation-transporting P-type ATPase [Candidatus Woesearchaeota archaeon]|nr:cation-transporting P-type ATPase [Candidatus Woesearchaeota archaeon]
MTSYVGLSQAEAQEKLKQYGRNEMSEKKHGQVMSLLLSQFSNILSILLIIAAAAAFILGDMIEGTGMVVILLLNAGLGFFQEYQAEKAVDALRKLANPTAIVQREGKEERIPASLLVPGDVVMLSSGDLIPADGYLVEAISFEANESSLTGESLPAAKHAQGGATREEHDPTAKVFQGTAVVQGRGLMRVTATGMRTEFGKIAHALQTEEQPLTPLQRHMEILAKHIGIAAILLILLVFILGLFQHKGVFDMLLLALSLAVATIPVALPTIVTLGLSFGSLALSKNNVLIKRIHAVESIGATTVICTDKTGTLTQNAMVVQSMAVDGHHLPLQDLSSRTIIQKSACDYLLRIAAACNTVTICKGHSPAQTTEYALHTFAASFHYASERHIQEFPFDAERKRMSVVIETKKKRYLAVQGALDHLLPLCTHILDHGKRRRITPQDIAKTLDQQETFANHALRIIAFAFRDLTTVPKTQNEAEQSLTFIGMVGLHDPPREDVAAAIEECRHAGIKVMMITGDHPSTAKAIAQQIGLCAEKEEIITGKELDLLSDTALQHRIDHLKIVARSYPLQKLRIVHALQKRGHIVTMTGDGINDAPAIKRADTGLAMGSGTEVTKMEAKAILLDDRFSSIVHAVKEGRSIYDKMIMSAKYLLACNSGEIFTILLSLMLLLPLPLLPLQILMINLLTDAIPALGLSMEKHEDNIMRRHPRSPRLGPLSLLDFLMILIFGWIMSIGTIVMFSLQLPDLDKARTIAFTTLVFFQLFAVMSSRSLEPSPRTWQPFTNPWLVGAVALSVGLQLLAVYHPFMQELFHTVALSWYEMLLITLVAAAGFVTMEASKYLFKRSLGQPLLSAR